MIYILPPSPRLREQTATVLAPFFMIEGQNDLGPARDRQLRRAEVGEAPLHVDDQK